MAHFSVTPAANDTFDIRDESGVWVDFRELQVDAIARAIELAQSRGVSGVMLRLSSDSSEFDDAGEWRRPRDMHDLAAQANRVATMVLNGTIDLGKANTYAALNRVVVEAMSLEASRNQFLRRSPNLSLDSE